MPRVSLRSCAVAAAITAVVVVPIVWASRPGAARSAAQTTAGEAPACIQIPAGAHGYVAATSLADLIVIRMWSNYRFHGVLVVGAPGETRLYNWSYRQARWSPLPNWASTFVPINCVPRPGYLKALTWFSGRESLGQPAARYVGMGGQRYLIPPAYEPSTQGATYLSINAAPPDFGPTSKLVAPPHHLTANLEFRSRDWLESVASKSSAQDPGGRPTPPKAPFSYVERDLSGRVTTSLSCPAAATERNTAPCQHRFYRDGAMWSFSQSIADVRRWRELQDAFIARMKSFSEAAARCEAAAARC